MEAIEPWITPGIVIAVGIFLYRELVSLRERMARLEGRFDEMSRYIAAVTGRHGPPSGEAT